MNPGARPADGLLAPALVVEDRRPAAVGEHVVDALRGQAAASPSRTTSPAALCRAGSSRSRRPGGPRSSTGSPSSAPSSSATSSSAPARSRPTDEPLRLCPERWLSGKTHADLRESLAPLLSRSSACSSRTASRFSRTASSSSSASFAKRRARPRSPGARGPRGGAAPTGRLDLPRAVFPPAERQLVATCAHRVVPQPVDQERCAGGVAARRRRNERLPPFLLLLEELVRGRLQIALPGLVDALGAGVERVHRQRSGGRGSRVVVVVVVVTVTVAVAVTVTVSVVESSPPAQPLQYGDQEQDADARQSTACVCVTRATCLPLSSKRSSRRRPCGCRDAAAASTPRPFRRAPLRRSSSSTRSSPSRSSLRAG